MDTRTNPKPLILGTASILKLLTAIGAEAYVSISLIELIE